MSKRLTTLVTAAVLTAAPVGIVVTASPAAAADCTAPKTRLHVSSRPVVLDTTRGVQLHETGIVGRKFADVFGQFANALL